MTEVRNNDLYRYVDYVLISDFDGLNNAIAKDAVLSCFDRNDWDVCAANQQGPYYDLFALRHKVWCPNDCWEQQRFLLRYGLNPRKSTYAAVYAKMITIPPESEWIEVDSAYGGLALYKKVCFDIGVYNGLNSEGREVCEHVSFHRELTRNGKRVYINPKFINAVRAEHTSRMKNLIKELILMFGSERWLKKYQDAKHK